MSAPIYFLASLRGYTASSQPKTPEVAEKRDIRIEGMLCKLFSLTLVDIAIFITTLVVGLIGVFSVIHMPTAAWGSLLGVTGGIGLVWMVAGIAAAAVKCRSTQNATKAIPDGV